MGKEKHVVMKHSLAKALLDAGVQHFDSGGITQGGIGGMLTPQNEYQVSSPDITTQANLVPNIGAAQGRNTDVYNQQNNLAQALLKQTQGGGPNPAQTMLNTATGNNVANTAALIASSRGASVNPGQVARAAAMNGANIQQQAAGQGATLEAQQELEAQKELQNLYGTQGSNALQEESILQGALAAENASKTTGQLGAAQINASAAQNNANNAASTTGGLLGSIGGAIGGIFGFARGGKVLDYMENPQHFDGGGIAQYATPVDPRMILNISTKDSGVTNSMGFGGKSPKSTSAFSSDFSGANPESLGVDTTMPTMSGTEIPGAVGTPAAIPDLMPAFGSLIPTGQVAAPSLGAALLSRGGAVDYRSGGSVPGKGVAKGDSPKNDTVPAMLSPGEEVLPRSVTQAPDAPERAKKFVQALMDKKGEGPGFAKVVKARGNLKDRVARLEKLCGGGMA